jgi:hypothetical protein
MAIEGCMIHDPLTISFKRKILSMKKPC